MSPFTVETLAARVSAQEPTQLAQDEAFWTDVRGLYDVDPTFVQLNYGYFHPAVNAVFDASESVARQVNRRASHFKRFQAGPLHEEARSAVAELVGADSEEVVVTRSASEALNLVIGGLELQAGDEIVCSDQDYTAAAQALGQRAAYDGVVLRPVKVPLSPETDDEVVAAFRAQVGPRTKLILVTQLIHISGQILPVAELCAVARQQGVPVLVDAAHAVGQLDLDVHTLGCDYLAGSLHKWVGGPLGTGVLYLRRDRIEGLRPLFGDTERAPTDVRKLERFGNGPDGTMAGLVEALRWHRAFGSPLKRARLSLLRRRWTSALAELPGFSLLTPTQERRCAAIGLFTLRLWPAAELADRLLAAHGIYTVVQTLPQTAGVRVVPGLPTSPEHLDRLVDAVRTLLASRAQP